MTVDGTASRKELGDFLRTRRARLSPGGAGLQGGGRRRTPGLRREEVALLADVGVAWYTWLEQGREINASPQVLGRLARALKLTDDEREHLFVVALRHVPLAPVVLEETVSPVLQHILDNQSVCPAYIMGRRWDVLAWNRAACAVFRDFATMPAEQRNSLWSMFLIPEQRRLIVDWEGIAQRMLAQFRVDVGLAPDDSDLRCLLGTLRRESAEFRRWWPRHDVQGRRDGRKELDHPQVGRLALEHTVFCVNDAPQLRLVVYTPADADAVLKLQRLALDAR